LLATSSFEIVLTIFALNRLGYAILFLSTRLTAPAYARLMDMADCHSIIHSNALESVVLEISKERPDCTRFPLLSREDWHGRPTAEPCQRTDVDLVKEGKKMAWIVHSSGSTGFPKPIFLTNLQCLANFRKSFAMRTFCISPLFHSHALMETGRCFYTRAPMFLGNHSFPVTSDNLLEAMKVAKPQLVSAVPYVLKLLAEKKEGVRALARAELVLYAGSSCPDDLGDSLVLEGVNLVANYGATETGQIMTSFRPPGDKEWSYMRLWQPVAEFTLMDEIAPGVFECVGLDGLPSKGPSNSKPPFNEKNPANSFRTADLFTRHPDPQKSNFYKYLSRLDDRITLVNGEKVLPLPIEGRIRQEEIVREAVVFGYQQTLPGVLVFRAPDKAVELSDSEYLDAVWPAIEAANARAETFSRIIRELVVIKSGDCIYPRTDKGTFIRAQVYQQFESDIKQAYAKLDTAPQTSEKLSLTIPELEEWLLERFHKDLKIPLKDTKRDIFAAGVDSLQTTRIWRSIRQKLDLGNSGEHLGQNVVFEKGTVSALARHLYQLRTGEEADEREDEIEVMKEMIERYSKFTTHIPTKTTKPQREVVIVTGATGNLGAFIVAEMLRRPDVAEVWALVRAPGPAAAGARVMQALASRNLRLSDHEASKLHAAPSDFSDPNLGLSPREREHLLSTLTCVVHSAWAVNFNLGVRSFENQHIRGVHNLINFSVRSALPSPAKFFFCSSVSVGSGTPKPASIAETAVEDLRHAQSTGYGRSKLVAEHITRNAMRSTGMQSQVLRIGQLSGDRMNAIWKDTEAIALMIRSALTVGALPALDERPSWLPVDVCAQAATEVAMAETDSATASDPNLVYHLVNPQTFSWKDDLLPALKQCERLPAFDVVSPQQWLKQLAASDQDPVKNPSVKLIDFWRGKYEQAAPGKEELDAAVDDLEPKGLTFETVQTVRQCPSLARVQQPVAEGLIQRYVQVWLEKWLSV